MFIVHFLRFFRFNFHFHSGFISPVCASIQTVETISTTPHPFRGELEARREGIGVYQNRSEKWLEVQTFLGSRHSDSRPDPRRTLESRPTKPSANTKFDFLKRKYELPARTQLVRGLFVTCDPYRYFPWTNELPGGYELRQHPGA